MNNVEYEVELADSEPRPLKRPRQRKDGDDGHRPYNPQSAPSGPPVDAEDSGESGTRKGRKRPLSCGECRRLKLKCDRVFPCQSCRKRGCAEICPEGALTGGKGSRFILANTEQLHDKIKVMSERIHQLEEGLRTTNSRLGPTEHPLLRQELLLIKKSPELFGIDQHVMGHEATPDSQHKNDEPTRTSPEGSSKDTEEYNGNSHPSAEQHKHPGFSEELSRLCRAFPSPWSISFELDLDTRQHIRDRLPHRQEAQRLCDQARRNAFWQHNPDASETFLSNLIHSVYTTPLPALLPHRLGLFLMTLAIGVMVDLQHGPDRALAEQYHSLARIAMCEVPLMDDTSLDAVNALFFMEWYLLTFSDHKKALEYAWGIMGLATKLAHTISLHRDGVRSKLIPEESDKRRTLFWDLMGADVRLGLLLRRPPSISMRHVDAKQPSFSDEASVDATYHGWHYGFLAQCMMPVLDVVTSTQPIAYSDVLGLDSRIRNFAVPPQLQMLEPDGQSSSDVMRQAMTTCTREVALLHLHRNYFTQALITGQDFTVKHKYAPSVLAVFSSARTMIWAVDLLYQWEPALSSRFMIFWSNCFSAACALCFLVSRAPGLAIVPSALQELDKVTALFKRLSEQCPRVSSYLPVLDKFIARGREYYVNWRGGVHTPYDEMTDEICVLVRRIAPAVNDLHGAADTELEHPFDFAHAHLRRILNQATAADPCTATEFHLTRIRGPVGSILHPQSDVRSYSGPSDSRSSLSSPWSNSGRSDTSYPSSSTSALGADIADSSWMSWL